MRIFSVVNARPRDAVWRHWTISTAFIVHAPVDLSVLERAFRATMRKYVEARSVFRDVGGSLRVDTLPTSEFALSGAPTRQHSREEALAAARSDAWRGFESFQEPLVALRVYPVDDGSTLIASQVSHLLADGGSMEILVNDIMLSYFGGGVASPGGGGPLFSDYVDWEERFLASEEGAAQREFWRVRQPPSPTLAALSTQYADSGVQFVGLDTRDSDVSARAFDAKYGIDYPSVIDRDGQLQLLFSDSLPPQAIPSTLVVDADGKVAARVLGRASESTLRGVIDPLLAESSSSAPPPSPSASKSAS